MHISTCNPCKNSQMEPLANERGNWSVRLSASHKSWPSDWGGPSCRRSGPALGTTLQHGHGPALTTRALPLLGFGFLFCFLRFIFFLERPDPLEPDLQGGLATQHGRRTAAQIPWKSRSSSPLSHPLGLLLLCRCLSDSDWKPWGASHERCLYLGVKRWWTPICISSSGDWA